MLLSIIYNRERERERESMPLHYQSWLSLCKFRVISPSPKAGRPSPSEPFCEVAGVVLAALGAFEDNGAAAAADDDGDDDEKEGVGEDGDWDDDGNGVVVVVGEGEEFFNLPFGTANTNFSAAGAGEREEEGLLVELSSSFLTAESLSSAPFFLAVTTERMR